MRRGRWTTPANNSVDPEVAVGDLGEAALIDRIRERVPESPAWVRIGIGDDAAVVEPDRGALEVVTTDTLVEGVHFDRAFCTFSDLGYKALAVNLSDLAAMGATPRTAVLSLVLPDSLPVSSIDTLVEGLLALATPHRVALVGGNITQTTGPLVVGLTAIGAVKRRRVLTRSGGLPGDELWVTGTVGSAAAGLGCLRQSLLASNETLADCVSRYRRPAPRVRVGMLLGRNKAARAAVDLSDGLGDGIRQMTNASGLGAVVHASALPIAEAANAWFVAQGRDPVEAAIAGGDDYELLVAVPRRHHRRFAAIRRLTHGVQMTKIGELTKEMGLVVRTEALDRPMPKGYEHFQED